MRNNRQKITAVILLTVFVLTFFIAAGQKFLRPAAPVVPAVGNPSVRLTRDSGRESKGFFKRKEIKSKNEITPLSAEARSQQAEISAEIHGENDNKLSVENGINREKLRKDCKEKIRKTGGGTDQRIHKNSREKIRNSNAENHNKSIIQKPRKDHAENSGSYNNRGGKMS